MSKSSFHDATDEIKNSLFLRQSERLKLERQLNSLLKSNKHFIRMRATSLHRKWERFLEQDRLSQARNDRLLQELKRIDVQAAILASKSEQLKILKEQYERSLSKITPNWNLDEASEPNPKEIMQEEYERSLNKITPNWNLDEASESNAKNFIQPVHHSTPVKIPTHPVQQERGPEVKAHLEFPSTSAMEVTNDNVIAVKPTPPPRMKRNRLKAFKEATEPNSGSSSQESPSHKLVLRSSAIIRNKANAENLQQTLTEKSEVLPSSAVELERTSVGLSSVSSTSSQLGHSQNEVSELPIKSGKSDEIKPVVENVVDGDEISSNSIQQNGNNVELSKEISESSNQSSSLTGDTTSELTPSVDLVDNLSTKDEKLNAKNSDIKESLLQTSSDNVTSKKLEDLTLSSSDDDDFFEKKVPITDTYEGIISRSPRNTSSFLDEVDNDIEDELATALSGHGTLSQRKRSLNHSQSDENIGNGSLKPVEGEDKVVDEVQGQSGAAGAKSKQKSSTKWSMGVDSDSEVSFGNSTSIPGIDSDKDDFDFYD